MSKLLILAGFVFGMFFVSCSSDNDEESGGNSNLTGTWKIVWTEGQEDMLSDGLFLIQCKKDGSCVYVEDDEDGVTVLNAKYNTDEQHI